jgi:hypothetical protein
MDGDIKEERDGGCYISNAKGFFFLKNGNVHSFVDRGSIR